MRSNNALKIKKRRAAFTSVAANVCVTTIKIITAFYTGSVSVLSEALHSLGDIISSLLAYFSIRVGDKPADKEHPYGHGKVESFASLGESILLACAAGWVGYEAVKRIFSPKDIKEDVAIYVIGLLALLSFVVGRYISEVAKQTDSEALRANAAHIRADVITSIGVIVALLLVKLTNNTIFDPILALGLSIWIFFTAVRLGIRSFQLLIDISLPKEEILVIENILNNHPAIKSWHQLRTRKSGSYRHIDAHILLDDDLSLIEAHALTEEVEDKIRESLSNVSISLHMEPFQEEVKHRQQQHSE